MSRSPVTIAIHARSTWGTLKSCLDSLRPTLGARDQVLLVDQGSTDTTQEGLRDYPWVEVVSDPGDTCSAIGGHQALASARHDIVIFLSDDTLLGHQWTDPLVKAFDDPAVGAAGPKSNRAAGDQAVHQVPYSSTPEFRRFARQWSREHRSEVVEADRLDAFCLAVRRPLLVELGGLDEVYRPGGPATEDLCQRIRQAGQRLVVCCDSFVHREDQGMVEANVAYGVTRRPADRARFRSRHGADALGDLPVLVSACLIVKDEEARIGACLSSLQGLVDEIVVYDTGSTDNTVEVSRRYGANVIQGYWDQDFARARNAALESCRGEWVAWLDADETWNGGDGADIRSLLMRTKPEIDAWSVKIQNLTGAGTGSGFSHHAARLFRRQRCEWTGRIHEQIARRETHAPIVQAVLEDGWILHSGYLDDTMQSRNKAERNLQIALAEVDSADGWDKGYSLTSLSRSLLLAGQPQEALDRATEALDCTPNAITRRLAVRAALDAALALGRLDDALDWCGRFRVEGADRNSANAVEASIRLARGEWLEALELLDAVNPDTDDSDGFGVSDGTVAAQKARALGALNRHAEAADVLLEAWRRTGSLDVHLGAAMEHSLQAGRPLTDLAAAIPPGRVKFFLAQVLQLKSELADSMLEACFTNSGPSMEVLATASQLAQRLPIERALVWAARIRTGGYPNACPLVAMARSLGPALFRARAAAACSGVFGDPRAVEAFWNAYNSATPQEQQVIRREAGQLNPGLLAETLV